ncbi:GDSL-type esterase/lipase family protein [Chitinophaga arvensicola]|uniref:GDSL-like Lipase/Acylhydrolase n=1 Tax=Chitinophaga arvensicola TaxID=29529 RepID=A0A1I0NGA4_9BACT|nr:GDSL-type esterase/lipase family protein [Chitinophaga arvensicola]SEW00186.1 GDSL-like Lipase/Acylhydrolase [Chitinophaga arvensicola]
MNTVRHNNLSRKWVTVLLLVLSGFSTYAQQQPSDANSIQQDTALYRVFNSLAAADSNVVSILHLGDSHIQAGYFSMTTASLLQNQFGYAGRGYVFPYNLAGTNGPEDYRWNSTTRWSSERVVDRNKSDVLGPGAIVISSQNDAPTLSFAGKPDGSMDNNFRKVTLFYDAGNSNNTLVVPDATVTVTPAPFPGSPTLSKATLDFLQTSQSFQARWEGTGNGPFRFYGAIMENSRNGVLYHSVGINGAMYQQYNEFSNILLAEMETMKPQLVIISLGTNEAYGGRMDPLAFRDEIDKAVTLIREQNPSVNILLTTPPDCMRAVRKATRKKVGKKKYKTIYHTAYYPNPYISMVTQQIMGYARQHGIACWNFNLVNKTQSSKFAGAWAPDHIHFNVRGYQVQGQLLYEALERSYTHYLQQTKKNPVTSNDRH